MPGSRGRALLHALAVELTPYDPRTARRVAAGIITGFAVMLFVLTALIPPESGSGSVLAGYVAPPLLLLWSAALLWWRSRIVDHTLVLSALLSAVIIWAMNLVTRDASAGAQVAFCAPVLFAGFQLRKAGAVLVTAGCLLAEAHLVFRFEPPKRALSDLGSVGFVLIVIATVLIVACGRQDRLITALERRASIDPLTGLVTRRVLDEAVRSRMDRDGRGTALVLADVDFFKEINDTHGHVVGDQALRHVADVLRVHSRPDDVVGRIGGDELAVLLPDCDPVTARRRAEDFVLAVRRAPMPRDGHEALQLSISVGVSHAPGGAGTLESLYGPADESLYDAKRSGRGRVGRG